MEKQLVWKQHILLGERPEQLLKYIAIYEDVMFHNYSTFELYYCLMKSGKQSLNTLKSI